MIDLVISRSESVVIDNVDLFLVIAARNYVLSRNLFYQRSYTLLHDSNCGAIGPRQVQLGEDLTSGFTIHR